MPSAPLPPGLAQLEAKYLDVYASFERGALSMEDAIATVEQFVEFDGDGFEWRIDPLSGAFLRGRADVPPYEANPQEYVDPQLSPADDGRGTSFGFDGHLSPATGRDVGHAGDPFYSPNAPGPTSSGRGGLSSVLSGAGQRWAGLEPRRRKIILVALVCAAILGFVALRGGGESTTTFDDTHTQDFGALPDGFDGASAGEGTVPDGEDVSAAIAAIVSGDRSKATSVLVDPGDAADTAAGTALWSGFVNTGSKVSPGGVTPIDNGSASQVWTVTDDGSDETLFTVEVTWLDQDGAWMLSTWPSQLIKP